MRQRTLLTQVLAVNALLVVITAVVTAVFAAARLDQVFNGHGMATLAIAVLAVILLNSLLLRHRLEPLDRLVRTMDEIDLTDGGRATPKRHAAKEIRRLTEGFNRMLDRLEEERRSAGRAVVRAQ